jgi:hypothetical protein
VTHLVYFWLGLYAVPIELTWLGTSRRPHASGRRDLFIGIDVLALELYQDWEVPKPANNNIRGGTNAHS